MTHDKKNGPTTFAEMLEELGGGEVCGKLDRELEKVCEAVSNTKKAGTLTLTISIKNENGFACIQGKVKGNAPEEDLRGALFYFGKDGSLLKDDPRQLPLRGVTQLAPVRGEK